MATLLTFVGKTYTITYDGWWYKLDWHSSDTLTYDSFEQLVEEHPICEEARAVMLGIECPGCGLHVEPVEDKSGCGCHCPVCNATL